MYKLAEAQMKAFEDEEYETACELAKIQQDFLKEHLLEWAPMFLINVKSEASTAFYFDIADFALEFMLSDFEYLSQLITDGKCNFKI
jgi:TorA maturation chaperone TorD